MANVPEHNLNKRDENRFCCRLFCKEGDGGGEGGGGGGGDGKKA